MRKSVFWFATVLVCAVVSCLQCGPSYCKQYVTKFCGDEKSPACADAKAKVKNWSSSECRIQVNTLAIEQQSKEMEKILE